MMFYFNNQNPLRVMIQNEDQNLYTDLRFWVLVVFSTVLLGFLILSYPG